MASSSSSSSSVGQKSNSTQPQVFINFRGELRTSFVSHLEGAMVDANINVFIDKKQENGDELQNLIMVKIKNSSVALAIICKEYTTSIWCLEELVKIKECVDQGSLIVLPIFFKLKVSVVEFLEGKFGDNFRKLKRENQHQPLQIQKWKEALKFIAQRKGMSYP